MNIPDQRLEVYREPVPDGAAPFGRRYGPAVLPGPGEWASPLTAPEVTVAVTDPLP